MNDRILPNHQDIERMVLGACMLGGLPALEQVRAKLEPEAFYHSHHRLIYGALCRLASQGKPLDQSAVVMDLEANKHLETIAGPVTVAQIASDVATDANVEYHAGIVADDWTKRQVIVEAQKAIELAYDAGVEVVELCAGVEKKMRDLTPKREGIWQNAADGMREAYQRVVYARENPGALMGVKTGIPRLDDHLGGLMRGDLILVAARPSMGKTAFGLHIARSCGVPVAFISAEMGTKALSLRLLAAEVGMDSQKMHTGQITDDENESLKHSLDCIDESNIDLTAVIRKPSEIAAYVRRLKARTGCGLVVVDYLQLLTPDGKHQNREREVASIADDLKHLAISLDIPVVAMVQLSRAPEQRQDKRPALSDMRDSGTLEQTADVVAFLYRGEYYEPAKAREEGTQNLCEILISKHRNGPTGYVKAYFDRATGVWGGWVDDGGSQAPGGASAFDGGQGQGAGGDSGGGAGVEAMRDVPRWVNE